MWTPSERAVPTPELRLAGVHVVDVVSGSVQRDRDVDLVDGRIAVISPAGTTPPAADASVVDLAGHYLAPGLISVHTHLTAVYPFSDHDENETADVSALRAMGRATDALRAGITTVRCLDESNRADLAVRTAARQGWVEAPRILGAGKAISTTGGHGHGFACSYADGHDGFLKAARTEFAAGADHVKIFITGGIAREGEDFVGAEMTADELRGAVRAATERGKYVVAHAGHGPAIREAIAAGVRSFEHAYDVDLDAIAEMKATEVFVTPTLSVTHCAEWMAAHHFTPWQIERAMSVGPGHLASIRRIVEHGRTADGRGGVTFVTGTDYPPGEPYEDTVCQVREMELMVDAGLTPAEVLRAATADGARLVRLADEIGQVREGMAADLIVTEADPTEDVRALRRIRAVVQAGRIVRQEVAA